MIGATTLLLLIATTSGRAEDAQTKATAEILAKLMEGETNIRPSITNDPTRAKVQTYIRNIDVDDLSMKVTTDLTFRMHWNDPRLTFDTEGVDYVTVLDPKDAWIPDAFFKNAETTRYSSIHTEHYFRVYPNGDITYSTRLSVELKCVMDLVRFPHDTQRCDMMIASYGYTTRDLIFNWKAESPTEVQNNLQGGRFGLQSFNTGYCNSETSTGSYSCVNITFVLKRDFGAYLIEWYLPTIFLIVVGWFSFLIPKEQFLGRLLLTLIPLVALASFVSNISQGLASVPYIRALDIFTGFSLAVLFLTLVHIIVCYIKGVKSNTYDVEAGKSDNPEEGGGGKPVELEEVSGFKKLVRKVKSKAEFLSRVVIVGFYISFLFVYFAAYCGTG